MTEPTLEEVVAALEQAHPAVRRRVLGAAIAIITASKRPGQDSYMLFRAIDNLLDELQPDEPYGEEINQMVDVLDVDLERIIGTLTAFRPVIEDLRRVESLIGALSDIRARLSA